jgi:hypothetical protein
LNVEKKTGRERSTIAFEWQLSGFSYSIKSFEHFGEAENGKMVNKSLKRFSGTCKQTAMLQLVAFKQ